MNLNLNLNYATAISLAGQREQQIRNTIARLGRSRIRRPARTSASRQGGAERRQSLLDRLRIAA